MDSQRNFFLITFVLSCMALWFNWGSYQQKKIMENAPTKAAIVAPQTNYDTPTDGVQIPTAPSNKSTNSTNNQVATPQSNIPATHDKNDWVEIKTPLFHAWLSQEGMNIVKVELLKHRENTGDKNLVLMDAEGKYQYSARTGLTSSNSEAPNHLTPFFFEQSSYEMIGDEKELMVSAIAKSESGLVVTKSWTFYADRYEITQQQSVENRSLQEVSVAPYYLLTHNNQSAEGNSFAFSTFQGPAYFTNDRKYNKVDWSDVDDDPESLKFSDDNGWMAMVEHYFLSAWILPESSKRNFFIHAESQANLYSAGLVGQAISLPAGGRDKFTAKLYVGPQDQDSLEKLAKGLDLVVDYGILTVIAKPLFGLMQWIYSIVGNWGWTIILLTVIIKTAFYPLSAASYKSMARMRKLTPKMTELRKKYANDKQKQQQELIKLYKTEKVNPLGGCLPIFVQIPVFLALYWVLLGSVEIRSAAWLGWIQDLAQPDPYYILPIIMALSMFIQTKLNPPPPDPMQAKLMTIMPLVFSIFFFFFPSGLVLYWVVNNLLSIAQQQYNNKKYGEPVKKK